MAVPEPAPSPASEARACLNCGEPLLGPYCWSCGQEDVDLHRPLKQLAQDAVGDLLDLDTRLLRTLGPLFFRPGALTREYLAGRRVRFVPPLKMFLLASLIFFGLVALLPKDRFAVYRRGEAIPPGKGLRFSVTLPEYSGASSGFDHWNDVVGEKAIQHPQEFGEALLGNLPRAFFVLLPLFALFLKLFYWHQDRYYLDHLIFAFYHHAFGFMALALLVILGRPWVPGWLATPLVPILWLWFFVYLALALRKVYGGSRWKTALKFAGLLSAYAFAFIATVLLLIFVTLWWF
jgi:hypothetical protein